MALLVTIKVFPQSGRQEMVWDVKRGILKCYLKSAPERNMANNELCSFVRKLLSCGADQITLVRGHTSRTKQIRVDIGITLAEFYLRCGIVAGQQQGLF